VTSVNAAGPATAGGTVAVSATVQNTGEILAGELDVRFVFATNAQLTTGRVDSGAGCIISGLAPGGAESCMPDVPVPPGLPTGNYFVGAVADFGDAVTERNETNNERATAQAIFIQGLATPTTTPTRPPQPPCRDTISGCSGSCPNPGEICFRLAASCSCIRLSLPSPTPTATPTPSRRCGLLLGQCGGSCPRGQFCINFPSCRCITLGLVSPTDTANDGAAELQNLPP
jgi:hypothetical protein